MKEQKVKTWIIAGYNILSSEGWDGIIIERLAHTLGLNKSGFYHYFGSMENFTECLLQHHFRMAQKIGEEIRKCKAIDRDLLHLIVRYKVFFLVESQLLIKSKPVNAKGDIDVAGKILGEEFLALLKKSSSKLPEDSSLTLAYLDILRYFFYARINSNNINYQFLRQLTSETVAIMNKLTVEKYFLTHRSRGHLL